MNDKVSHRAKEERLLLKILKKQTSFIKRAYN
jgi:hypothetical protein